MGLSEVQGQAVCLYGESQEPHPVYTLVEKSGLLEQDKKSHRLASAFSETHDFPNEGRMIKKVDVHRAHPPLVFIQRYR